MQQPMLFAFLKELFQRLAIKSPKFFKVVQWISGALTAITGIPELLHYFNVVLPQAIAMFENKAIAFASAGALFVSMLTTQSKPAAITEAGQVLKTTDNAKLPFTQKSEEKAAEKIPDIPVIAALPTEPPPIETDHIKME